MPEELRVGSPEAWGSVLKLPEWSFRRVAWEHGLIVLWKYCGVALQVTHQSDRRTLEAP